MVPSLILAAVVALLNVTACRAADEFSASAQDRPLTLSQFVAGIVTRSSDLKYITEQDSEVFAFYRNATVKEISEPVFLKLIKLPVGSQVIQQSWASFFQMRTQNDPTGGWANLRNYLEANLTNLTVIRVPRASPYDAQYDVYAIGIFNGNLIVGVQMFGVAT